MALPRKARYISSSQVIFIGFFCAIALGTLLLMLPFATNRGGGAPFLDALFTSTSAVCVTGLVVQDTATYWSAFGQAVILLLIQVGGLGIVTLTVAVSRFAGRKIGLRSRSTMQEAISAPNLGGIVKLTGFIVKTVAVIEGAGALLISPVFIRDFGFFGGIWRAVFHSVSAFCNAGFDLMGVRGQFSSLTSYAADPLVNIVTILLILIGGIGFVTWDDMRHHGLHIRRWRMQSKVVLAVTAALLVLPFCFFFFFGFSGSEFADMDLGERVLASAFQTVTPRTAGFNTVDLTKLGDSSAAVTIILMLIGGAPGSTAGGMKTTTVAVLCAAAFAAFRRKKDVRCFGRRIGDDAVRNAVAVIVMYAALFLVGSLLICRIEGLPLLSAMFETASAVGTVGMSLGLTPALCAASRVILIFLMFFGRVGGMTFIFAALSEKRADLSHLPQEKITVG